MSYEDKSLLCQDCGLTFTFTATQQEYLASKGLTREPRRCPTCRNLQLAAAKPGIEPVSAEATATRAKERRAGRLDGIAELEAEERRGSRARDIDEPAEGDKKGPRVRERRGQPVEETPPPPRGFGGPPRPSFNRPPPSFAPSGPGPMVPAGPLPPRQFFPAVCSQCGKQTQVPFQPRGDRPVYCMDCFRQQRAAAAPR